ncbi:inactive leucine-rich repeat receptor protein [Salix suchowensis]|nr:inactive leucine-rich repeat receptor protein [Salix suchowensis]
MLYPCADSLYTTNGGGISIFRNSTLRCPCAFNWFWNSSIDFCNSEPNASVTVVCYEKSITQLHIVGNKGTPRLPGDFSIDSFVTTLVGLPSLKVLTLVALGLWGPLPGKIARLSSLEILNVSSNFLYEAIPRELSSLSSIQSLGLDDNMFAGEVPNWIGSLQEEHAHGSLPDSLTLSHNYFQGEVPDLGSLRNLQVLDLEDNAFGPQFPKLGNKLVSLVLSKNKFRDGLPAGVTSYYQLQRLDLSNNTFVDHFHNHYFCGFVHKSLTGRMPNCLLQGSKKKALYAGNCLDTGDQNQHPISICRNEALAVGILSQQKKRNLLEQSLQSVKSGKTIQKSTTRVIAENASIGYPSSCSRMQVRYISQTMKLGALGLPAYRTFSLEELEEATNNFNTSAFMGDRSQGKIHRGRLKDGSFVVIRCLKMKRSHGTHNFMQHIELISKLRHRHLVSALGHGFEYYLDDSSVSRIFLVFEYVPSGTLRSWISGGHARQKIHWTHRIAAAIGVAKGIQFLHTGIVPDVLLDQNLIAKISSYNLPLLEENGGMVGHGASSGASKDPSLSARKNQDEKVDVYDFGLILLEILVGRSLTSGNDVDALQDQLQASISSDDAARRSLVDPAVRRVCSYQSLKTMMEICVRCLLKNPADRPSIEDILWNLQFAAQVQDPWRGDSQSSEGSPVTPTQQPQLHITMHKQ